MHIVSNVFSDLQDGCLLSNKAAEVLSIGVPSLPQEASLLPLTIDASYLRFPWG